MMLNWRRILFPGPSHPIIPNLRSSRDDGLYFDSLTRGCLAIGKPGVGKTVWTAMQTLKYAQAYPDRPIFSLDASGSFTDEFIKLVYQLPPGEREPVERRIIFDRLGDPDWVVPMPFFSRDYGLNYEEQVQRVTGIIKKLSEHLVKQTPVMALSITETAPELFRLLCAIQNERGECWQITEAKKLLVDGGMLRRACKQYGSKVPEAKWYFEHEFLSDRVSDHERELRTYTFRSILGMVEPRSIRARLGGDRPGWTPKEAIDKGLIVLVSGEALINQEQAQAILFSDAFSQLLAVINKRVPHDPRDKHVLLVIDEVPMLIRMPAFALEIGRISPMYRSRRMQIFVILQALWQMDENLREQIWSLGNVACFSVEDFHEAYGVAQQLFSYDPRSTKMPPSSAHGQPVLELDRGQFLTAANWLQHLKHRELVLKRYLTEAEEDPFVAHISQTSEKPSIPLREPLIEIKERLLRRRAIPVKDALKMVNRRKITYQAQPRKRPTVNGS